MSIEINSIKQNQINTANNSKIIAFKSKPMPNDKIELSTKKELSNGTKIGIGVGIATVIGLGIELIWGKGKHLKTLWEKISGKGGKKPPKKPEGTGNKPKGINEGEKPKTTGTNTLPHITDFKNINEAKEYFESIGVKTVFKSGSERHLSDLNKIKNDLVILEKNGVALPKPESIIINDWHNKEELKQILGEMNIKETIADFCNSNTWAWGTVAKGNNSKCHVLINSSFYGDYGHFIHEMGHIHQDFLKSSYWHSKGLSDKEFLEKQIEVLGLSDVGLHDDGINMIIRDFGVEDTPSILRGYTSSNASSSVKAKLKQMFPNINNDSDYEKLFTIFGKDERTYIINAKKMVDKMYSESGVYAPSKSWENVAEIFQGLNKGEEYSDLVMLMYDICGGGRVPNLVIKGKKYDDYIESLYNNPDLIRQLRECIDIKELV